jgi:broad specificity phosphatase PhoE
MNQTIWMARHGARADYVNGEWIRWEENPHDAPLSALGMIQAQEMAQFLGRQDIQHIFASPYLRTLQTVWPTAQTFGLPIKVENGLGECLGEAISPPELLSPEERQQRFPLIDSQYRSWMPVLRGPESEEASHRRAGAVVQSIAERYHGNLLILGHGITVLGGVRALVGGQERLQTLFAGISRIERNHAGWKLITNGDTSHLHEGAGGIQHIITI